mmetsp:Transcript_96221/g.161814  ORF Transcript_96221/g.161814 Transcript_96221/m.161814 type:complete len:97 (+) Transcript_96221:210-500(+)
MLPERRTYWGKVPKLQRYSPGRRGAGCAHYPNGPSLKLMRMGERSAKGRDSGKKTDRPVFSLLTCWMCGVLDLLLSPSDIGSAQHFNVPEPQKCAP